MAMEVYDLDNNLRATIEESGEVKTPDGKVVAFVNEDGSVGDLDESLLGDLSGGQAVDANDKLIGSLDQGNGSLKKGQSHWAQVVRGGEIRDKHDAHRGKVNDFTFHQFLKIAGYLFFVDQGLIQDDLPSLVAGSGPSHVPAPKPAAPKPVEQAPTPKPAPTPAADPWVPPPVATPAPAPAPVASSAPAEKSKKDKTKRVKAPKADPWAAPPAARYVPPGGSAAPVTTPTPAPTPVATPAPTPAPVKSQEPTVESTTPKVQQLDLAAPSSVAPSSNTQHVNLSATTPAPQVQHISLAAPPQPQKASIEKREYKKYTVGAFKGIEGGTKNTLEITSCDVPSSQLSIRLEKEGKDIVFKRTIMEGNTQKEQVQHFGMPYVVTKERIKVTYAPNTEGGTLAFLITKPAPGEAQASGSAGPAAGEFCRFVIAASPGADPSKRVSMGSAQAIDSFVFTPTGESKWETEIIGELANEGQALKFHCTVTVVEEKTKKKATQSISLPMTISLANIEVEGTKVTVYKNKTVQQASVPRAQIPSNNVCDCDVDIQVI